MDDPHVPSSHLAAGRTSPCKTAKPQIYRFFIYAKSYDDGMFSCKPFSIPNFATLPKNFNSIETDCHRRTPCPPCSRPFAPPMPNRDGSNCRMSYYLACQDNYDGGEHDGRHELQAGCRLDRPDEPYAEEVRRKYDWEIDEWHERAEESAEEKSLRGGRKRRT